MQAFDIDIPVLVSTEVRHERLLGTTRKHLENLEVLLEGREGFGKDDDVNESVLMDGRQVILTAGMLRSLHSQMRRAVLLALAGHEDRTV